MIMSERIRTFDDALYNMVLYRAREQDAYILLFSSVNPFRKDEQHTYKNYKDAFKAFQSNYHYYTGKRIADVSEEQFLGLKEGFLG